MHVSNARHNSERERVFVGTVMLKAYYVTIYKILGGVG